MGGDGKIPGGPAAFRRGYLAALQAHVGRPSGRPGAAARRLGILALGLGLGIGDVARIHHLAFAGLPASRGRGRTHRAAARRAGSFLASVLTSAGSREHLALLARTRAMEEELRQLSHSLLLSHEEERMRISRELHDELGQDLTAVNVHLASLRAVADADASGVRERVARTQRLVRKSMRTVHEFARSLRPKLLDDLGLTTALRGLAGEFAAQNRLRVAVSAPADVLPISADGRTALFRVAQEALVNVRRHARARNVRIALSMTPAGVSMEVWNDGRTFDVRRVLHSRTNRHLGLLCMRERMEMVGGTFSIRSARGKGTAVRADVPLAGATGGPGAAVGAPSPAGSGKSAPSRRARRATS